MQAIEFETKAKNGMIKIPKEYLSAMQDTLRVIILIDKSETKKLKSTTQKRALKALKLKTKGFKFDRDEANER